MRVRHELDIRAHPGQFVQTRHNQTERYNMLPVVRLPRNVHLQDDSDILDQDAEYFQMVQDAHLDDDWANRLNRFKVPYSSRIRRDLDK